MPDFVYIIRAKQPDGTSVLKIGTSTDVEKRLASLQTGYPFALSLVARWLGGRETELSLHLKFDKHRIQGEWFRSCAESEKLIEELIATGVLDLDVDQRKWEDEQAARLRIVHGRESCIPLYEREPNRTVEIVTKLLQRLEGISAIVTAIDRDLRRLEDRMIEIERRMNLNK